MYPALSVIFFTAVSGAGYGLLFLVGLALAIAPGDVDPVVVLVALLAGAVLTAAGLLSSMLHLGQPQRAWRALSQWRSSWLSREGVAALACYVPLLAMLALVWHHGEALAGGDAPAAALLAIRIAAILLALGSAITVGCTARIYSSLKTIPAWHNGHVLPGYLLFGLLGGTALLWLIESAAGVASAPWLRQALPVTLVVVAVACTGLKASYWRLIDRDDSAARTGAATGLERFGNVRPAEAPHTEANYLTREMGFVVARRNAARLRRVSRILVGALPLLLVVLAVFPGLPALPLAIAAALSVVAGTFVERWLFFAEARHVVMSYYR
jgi:DMSO reductase anchor subunit